KSLRRKRFRLALDATVVDALALARWLRVQNLPIPDGARTDADVYRALVAVAGDPSEVPALLGSAGLAVRPSTVDEAGVIGRLKDLVKLDLARRGADERAGFNLHVDRTPFGVAGAMARAGDFSPGGALLSLGGRGERRLFREDFEIADRLS